ncbi:flagellar FlbD family protein [Aquibacillus rhizosphaerae]|uniref:Flagellar FlbD family protein n=1 Tax=Aquibacillus rhizosphaerae TaxID=3051431 RepID=A0ABT7L2J0_9BACI|nr:flagellar FlbD family protein [Aquibacillus sp. LR5S19]MDL4840069.1 flagellar FlbD family protein [Aquibacillus sp. LR5S19]
MIHLTRLNGDKFMVNALYIEQIQSFPDTTLTLTNNKKLIVQEHENEVVQLVSEFYKTIGLQGCLKEIGEADES